jgi:hypothetical protein
MFIYSRNRNEWLITIESAINAIKLNPKTS